MARLVWTDSAISDLDAIADYIALDKPSSAKQFVKNVFEKVELLETFPEMCPFPHDLPTKRYRHLSVPPVRIFYRIEEDIVFIVYVMRAEKHLRIEDIEN